MYGQPLNPRLLGFARDMRQHPTSAEAFIWKVLRNRYFAGLKFRRQYVIEPYIADFYCAELRLVVELDGSQHMTAQSIAYDQARTDYLNAFGIIVVRYPNAQVVHQPETMLQHLWSVVQELRASP